MSNEELGKTDEGQSRLTVGLGDYNSASEVQDKGTWEVSKNGSAIQSDDFTHDVILRVTGDFYSDEQRKAYADNLAKKLNAPNEKVNSAALKAQSGD